MATNPSELAPGAEPEDLTPTDPNGAGNEPGAEGAGGDNNEPGPYDTLARDMGWTPKEEFQGPPEAWKPAEQFIRDGREIQRGYAAELKALRSTVDNISRTSAQMVETTIAQREEELVAKYNTAVEDGNAKEAFRLANDIQALKAPVNGARPTPPPESIAFAERNVSWFQKDPLATALAVDVCNRLAAQGYDNATQLQAAEKEVKRVYPNLFGQANGGKAPAGVNAPGQRAPAGNAGKPKGFADMPLESQKVGRDMAERLGKGEPDKFKEQFAKNYWRNAEGNA